MTEAEKKYWLALHQFSKFGPTRLKKISQAFPDPAEAFRASAKQLIAVGIEKNIAEEFLAARTEIDPEAALAALQKEKIDFITLENKSYPKYLSQIYDPPYILYYRGDISQLDEFNLAIVGTRKFTAYGRQATESIVTELARSGLTIISGLAMGIDTLAHEATLRANGRTVAVLGNGLDRASLYPTANRYLADKIVDAGGVIISEFPIGTPPLRHNFPQRNRIISGLSLGTLVIEAGAKSGSLITARHALEQNREVFAVPGSIYSPVSAGTNYLIKQGAKPVNSAADIIEALDLVKLTDYIDNKKIIPESKEEEIILNHLTKEPRHINDIIRLTKLDTATINSTLVLMEMKGIIKNLGGMEYVLAR